jgi:hypothetical protein
MDQRDPSSYRRWVAGPAISWPQDLSSDPSRHRTTIIRRFGFAKQTSRLDRPCTVEDARDGFRLIDDTSLRTVLRFTLRSLLPVGQNRRARGGWLWRKGCPKRVKLPRDVGDGVDGGSALEQVLETSSRDAERRRCVEQIQARITIRGFWRSFGP